MKPQLVLHLHKEEAKKKPKLLGDYIVTEKLDGIYVYIDYINDNWQVPHSRAGRPIPAFEHVKDELFELLEPPSVPTRFIAEATHLTIKDFHTINGIFNRSVGNYKCEEVIFTFHDMVEFGRLHVPAAERLEQLECWYHEDNDWLSEIFTIECADTLAETSDKEEWLEHFYRVKESGGEGIVLKHVDSPYYPDKRNSSLMKIKLEEQLVLHCVDVFYTVGEKGHSNLNATFRRNSGTEVVVRIGRYEDIVKIEEDKDFILGKPCLIEYMCEVVVGGSLREPRFKKVLVGQYRNDERYLIC